MDSLSEKAKSFLNNSKFTASYDHEIIKDVRYEVSKDFLDLPHPIRLNLRGFKSLGFVSNSLPKSWKTKNMIIVKTFKHINGTEISEDVSNSKVKLNRFFIAVDEYAKMVMGIFSLMNRYEDMKSKLIGDHIHAFNCYLEGDVSSTLTLRANSERIHSFKYYCEYDSASKDPQCFTSFVFELPIADELIKQLDNVIKFDEEVQNSTMMYALPPLSGFQSLLDDDVSDYVQTEIK